MEGAGQEAANAKSARSAGILHLDASIFVASPQISFFLLVCTTQSSNWVFHFLLYIATYPRHSPYVRALNIAAATHLLQAER